MRSPHRRKEQARHALSSSYLVAGEAVCSLTKPINNHKDTGPDDILGILTRPRDKQPGMGEPHTRIYATDAEKTDHYGGGL